MVSKYGGLASAKKTCSFVKAISEHLQQLWRQILPTSMMIFTVWKKFPLTEAADLILDDDF